MTTIPGTATPVTTIERSPATPVRSHESYEPLVEGVCHHSGRYLTRAEINPRRIALLYEQHDFPGFPALDDLFRSAVHSRQHQHLTWSRPGIRGLAALIAGLLMLGAAALALRRIEQYASLIEYVSVYAILIIGSLVGVGFIAFGVTQFARRNSIYHRQAKGRNPTIADFPLFGAYKIDAQERVTAHLRNDQRTPPNVQRAQGSVRVEVMPEANAATQYAIYRATYSDPSIGRHLHAGTVAFESLGAVTFTPDIEYGHRMALRQPVEQHVVRDGYVTKQPAQFEATYDIDPSVMYTDAASGPRFVLDFRPELKEYDSYTLLLRFQWLGDPRRICRLNECRLQFDPDLGKIVRVEQGRRVQNDGEEIVWRNLLFQDGALTLSVTFANPILNTPCMLKGSYEVDVNATLSGLAIRPEMVWNALGRRATERTQPSIRASSIIQGHISIATGLLSQEHELVHKSTAPVPCPPDYDLVRQVAQVLVENCEIDIQRIEQAAPRLDPRGTLQTELRYWDIVGRKYERELLEAIDVHVVIAGYAVTDLHALSAPQSYIDVRVRCLHDPRHKATPKCVETTCDVITSELHQIFGLAFHERSV